MSKDEVMASKNAAKKSRRRKKRRTVDVSDSSSSDSDSEVETKTEGTAEANQVDDDIVLTDEETNDTTLEKNDAEKVLENRAQDELNAIPFTKTDLTNKSDFIRRNQGDDGAANTVDLRKVQETIKEDRQKLESMTETEYKNQYLGMIFENYGEDINSLREAPDFTNKSLVILANVLKEGSAMFDTETLKTILRSK